MTTQLVEAARLALEALETLMLERGSIYDKAITALRAALADNALERMADNARELGIQMQPAQDEPMAVHQFRVQGCSDWYDGHPDYSDGTEAYETRTLYTHPQAREWVELTGDEVNEFAAGCHLGNSVQGAIRKAEAKLKEKNT